METERHKETFQFFFQNIKKSNIAFYLSLPIKKFQFSFRFENNGLDQREAERLTNRETQRETQKHKDPNRDIETERHKQRYRNIKKQINIPVFFQNIPDLQTVFQTPLQQETLIMEPVLMSIHFQRDMVVIFDASVFFLSYLNLIKFNLT